MVMISIMTPVLNFVVTVLTLDSTSAMMVIDGTGTVVMNFVYRSFKEHSR